VGLNRAGCFRTPIHSLSLAEAGIISACVRYCCWRRRVGCSDAPHSMKPAPLVVPPLTHADEDRTHLTFKRERALHEEALKQLNHYLARRMPRTRPRWIVFVRHPLGSLATIDEQGGRIRIQIISFLVPASPPHHACSAAASSGVAASIASTARPLYEFLHSKRCPLEHIRFA